MKSAKRTNDECSEEERLEKEHQLKELTVRFSNLVKKVDHRRGDIHKLLLPVKAHQNIVSSFKASLANIEEDYAEIKSVPKTTFECEKQLTLVGELMADIESTQCKHKEVNETLATVDEVVKTLDVVADESSLKEDVRDQNQRSHFLFI